MAKRGTTRFESIRQEKKIAKEIGGRPTPNSGAIDTFAGDVRNKDFLVEAKTTKKKNYILSVQTWDKIRREALRDGLREPVMQVDLLDGKVRLAVVDAQSFYPLVEEYLLDTETYSTTKNTYNLHAEKSVPYIVNFVNRFSLDCGTRDISLFVLKWEDFLYYYNNQKEIDDV